MNVVEGVYDLNEYMKTFAQNFWNRGPSSRLNEITKAVTKNVCLIL